MTIKTSSAKQKGRKLQQWVAERISRATGFPYGKDQPIESRPMGQSGVDVRLDDRVLAVFPWSIECKAQEKLSLHQWIEQARGNVICGTDWLLIFKRSRQKPVAVLDAEVLFNLLKNSCKTHVDARREEISA